MPEVCGRGSVGAEREAAPVRVSVCGDLVFVRARVFALIFMLAVKLILLLTLVLLVMLAPLFTPAQEVSDLLKRFSDLRRRLKRFFLRGGQIRHRGSQTP